MEEEWEVQNCAGIRNNRSTGCHWGQVALSALETPFTEHGAFASGPWLQVPRQGIDWDRNSGPSDLKWRRSHSRNLQLLTSLNRNKLSRRNSQMPLGSHTLQRAERHPKAGGGCVLSSHNWFFPSDLLPSPRFLFADVLKRLPQGLE